MNILARILSHGFAFAVVALIIIVLMYRGELFPGWNLPEFLVIQSQPGATAEAESGTVERTADEAALPADSLVETPEPPVEPDVPLTPAPAPTATSDIPPAVTPGSPEEPMTSGLMDTTNDGEHPADEMPVTGQADEVAPVASSDSESAADTHTAEAVDEMSATEPAASTGSTDQATDDTAVPTIDALPDESSTTVDDSLSTVTKEAASADIVPAAAEETTPADTEPVATEAVPAEIAPTAVDEIPPVDTEPVAAEATPAEIAPTTVDEIPPVDIAPTAADETPPAETEPVAAEAAPAEIAPTAVDETPLAETEPAAAEAAPVETAPSAAAEPELTPEVMPTTEPLAAPDKEEVPTAVDEAATETPYEVMAKARESYWLRDFDAAEQHYQRLTQIDPDNPDGYGEMGNMYFSQGKWDEAAAAFYEAGTRLVKQGLLVQAGQMVEVIRGLNGPQAESLEAQVVAASPSSP